MDKKKYRQPDMIRKNTVDPRYLEKKTRKLTCKTNIRIFLYAIHPDALCISISFLPSRYFDVRNRKKKKTKKLIDRVPKNSLAILPILRDTYKTI